MKMIIDIPEGLKNVFENERWTALDCMEMKIALINGTPLPKGHGRLIDADKLLKDRHKSIPVIEVINAPTIIEADKEN